LTGLLFYRHQGSDGSQMGLESVSLGYIAILFGLL
jgi:hypothetical protein